MEVVNQVPRCDAQFQRWILQSDGRKKTTAVHRRLETSCLLWQELSTSYTPLLKLVAWRFLLIHSFVVLVVKASASKAEDPGFESRFRRDFSWSSHTSDLRIDTPVATPPGARSKRASTGTGRSGVSILCLGEVESLIRNFYFSVAASRIV